MIAPGVCALPRSEAPRPALGGFPGPAPQRLAALVFVRPVALNGSLSIAARLIAARSIIWPQMNPSISFLARYFHMTPRTVIAAQEELADDAGFEYEWAKGHPTRRDRHRIVSLPPSADPRKSAFGWVGHRQADALAGDKTALLLLGLNSTGILLDVGEAAEVLGVSRRTAYRARSAVRRVCVMREGEDRSSALDWPTACEQGHLKREAAQGVVSLLDVLEKPATFPTQAALGSLFFQEDQEQAKDEPLLLHERRGPTQSKNLGDGAMVSPGINVPHSRLQPIRKAG